MNTCIILHNILVTNKVMRSCELVYDPTYSIDVEEEIEVKDQDIDEEMEESIDYHEFSLSNEWIMKGLLRDEHWLMLSDKEEYKHLTQVLMDKFE